MIEREQRETIIVIDGVTKSQMVSFYLGDGSAICGLSDGLKRQCASMIRHKLIICLVMRSITGWNEVKSSWISGKLQANVVNGYFFLNSTQPYILIRIFFHLCELFTVS